MFYALSNIVTLCSSTLAACENAALLTGDHVKIYPDKVLSVATPLQEWNGCYVYFLLRNDQIVYVGKSNSLHARIDTHKKDKIFDEVKYLQVEPSKQSLLELALIKTLKPIYNTQRVSKLTAHEELILSDYEFDEEALVSILRSRPLAERGSYGPVGYLDASGQPCFGLYDDDAEIEEHEDGCKMIEVERIIGDISKDHEHVQEFVCELCKCSADYIIMDGFLTYVDVHPDNVFDIYSEEFQPFMDRFNEEFTAGREASIEAHLKKMDSDQAYKNQHESMTEVLEKNSFYSNLDFDFKVRGVNDGSEENQHGV